MTERTTTTTATLPKSTSTIGIDASCTECHGDPKATGEVTSPLDSDLTCRTCHARTRFHWR
ncbi:MAG: hypothetical protein R3F49_09720 [Planctomycetota bacterium]